LNLRLSQKGNDAEMSENENLIPKVGPDSVRVETEPNEKGGQSNDGKGLRTMWNPSRV